MIANRIGYARTAAVDTKVLEAQVARLKAAGCMDVFTDAGKSGNDSKRAGLSAALAKLSEGDTLVVCELSRLSRSMEEKMTLFKELRSIGAEIESLDEAGLTLDWLADATAAAAAIPAHELRLGLNRADEEIPYAELDPHIVELCRAINEFPALETNGSCQGYIDGHREDRPWNVYFAPAGENGTTLEAYFSIEFLTWLINSGEAKAAGFDVRLRMNSFAPHLNSPGNALYFVLEGWNRHPTELAGYIRQSRESTSQAAR